jgi:hypothetical protein
MEDIKKAIEGKGLTLRMMASNPEKNFDAYLATATKLARNTPGMVWVSVGGQAPCAEYVLLIHQDEFLAMRSPNITATKVRIWLESNTFNKEMPPCDVCKAITASPRLGCGRCTFVTCITCRVKLRQHHCPACRLPYS